LILKTGRVEEEKAIGDGLVGLTGEGAIEAVGDERDAFGVEAEAETVEAVDGLQVGRGGGGVRGFDGRCSRRLTIAVF
jgi:hypothetical protein